MPGGRCVIPVIHALCWSWQDTVGCVNMMVFILNICSQVCTPLETDVKTCLG